MDNRKLIPLVAATVVIAAGGAVSASGQDTEAARTFTITTKNSAPVAQHEVDTAPKGRETPGDSRAVALPAFDAAAAKRVGRIEFTELLVPNRRVVVNGAVTLAGGQLLFSGVVDELESTYAVTGGTGTYAGAGGTVTVNDNVRGVTKVVVALR